MAILVRNGKLEAKGNIKRWGYSEVRLMAARRTGQFIKPVLARGRCGEVEKTREDSRVLSKNDPINISPDSTSFIRHFISL